jgi:hypothetical protein
MNPEPIKVTDVSGDPTVADVGEMLLNEGRGLDGVVDPTLELEPPPPQLISSNKAKDAIKTVQYGAMESLNRL